jgi:ribosomal protein S18 acetylase RimI-like enzyme
LDCLHEPPVGTWHSNFIEPQSAQEALAIDNQDSYRVIRFPDEREPEATEVMIDAFRDYPVMRFVIGNAGDDYERRLRLLVGFFTTSRFLKGYPVLGVVDGTDTALAAANINPPQEVTSPPELQVLWENVKTELGAEAVSRLDAFASACDEFERPEPHYHLGMIGVLHGQQGCGHARRLIETLHQQSRDDPQSWGVSLTTENPNNRAIYRHMGYREVGEVELDGLTTWGFERSDD